MSDDILVQQDGVVATVVLNRRELEYSVSGLMHPQYPAPDIKHLVDRLHTKSALRFLDLELSGPVELMPGVYCEAANAHTEGSMNLHVHTADGLVGWSLSSHRRTRGGNAGAAARRAGLGKEARAGAARVSSRPA